MPLQIYLAERKVHIDQIFDNVNTSLKKNGRCMVVVSEGLEIEGLPIPEEFIVRDAFGHASFGASKITVAQLLTNALNDKSKFKLAAKGAARCNVPGTEQRHSMAYASTVDLDESYYVGQKAALLAAAGEHGYMATILRTDWENYQVKYDKAPLAEVAEKDRKFPDHWITKCGTDVTDDFIKYARPLIGDDMVSLPIINGRLRLARMKPIFASQKLPAYIPQADREQAPK